MEREVARIPFFENTSVGKLKQKIYKMSDKEIDQLIKAYGIPSPGELEKPGSYIQNKFSGLFNKVMRKNVFSHAHDKKGRILRDKHCGSCHGIPFPFCTDT